MKDFKMAAFFPSLQPFLSVFLLKVHESCIASCPMESSLSDTCNQSDTRLHIIKRAENMWLAVYHQTFRGCPLLMNTSSVQQYIPMATETAVCQYFWTISPMSAITTFWNSWVCPFVGRYQGIVKNVLLTRNTALYVLTVCQNQISTTF